VVEIENTTGRNFKDLEGMLGNAKGIEKEQLGMQRNPYWASMAPRFSVFLDDRDSVTVYFTRCPSRAVGFGLKSRARMASRRNGANVPDPNS
jgi:hypothetical protein